MPKRSEIYSILRAIFPGRSPRMIEEKSRWLSLYAGKMQQLAEGRAGDQARDRQKGKRYSRLAQEASALCQRIADEVKAEFVFTDVWPACLSGIPKSLSGIAKSLEIYSKTFVRAVKRGAPIKHIERSLVREIKKVWTRLSENHADPIPLPTNNPKGRSLRAMTAGQAMGELCQAVGRMAGLDPALNAISAWRKRFKQVVSLAR